MSRLLDTMSLAAGQLVIIHGLTLSRVELNGSFAMVVRPTKEPDRYIVDAVEGLGNPHIRFLAHASNLKPITDDCLQTARRISDHYGDNHHLRGDMTLQHYGGILLTGAIDSPLHERRAILEHVARVRVFTKENKTILDYIKEEGMIMLVPRGSARPSGAGVGACHGWQHYHMCYGCGKFDYNMKRCSKCQDVHFCSDECAKESWPRHREGCKVGAEALKTKQKNHLP